MLFERALTHLEPTSIQLTDTPTRDSTYLHGVQWLSAGCLHAAHTNAKDTSYTTKIGSFTTSSDGHTRRGHATKAALGA